MAGNVASRINQLALIASVVLFAAIGLLWWSDRTRVWEEPRWDRARFVLLAAPDTAAARALVVALHPGCSHCSERLAQLAREGAADSLAASLGILVVDQRERPTPPAGAAALPAGVWWDSAGTWRHSWGRRVYGEAYLFTPQGQLERVIATSGDWREGDAR
ncbi:MAG: hypothetical protein IT348_15140 [Candidatus Eisenbacteria bacterium]|nr:hypothetical protein [Candidatus Eisenbacteria bacterium]